MEANELETAVTCIAPRDEIKDQMFDTGFWKPGETRMVEHAKALKMFAYVDTWAPGDAADAVKTSAENIKEAAKKTEQELEEEASQNLRDQIQAMDSKEGLRDFAAVHYQQKVAMNKSVQNMRNEVIGMIDRFGPR